MTMMTMTRIPTVMMMVMMAMMMTMMIAIAMHIPTAAVSSTLAS